MTDPNTTLADRAHAAAAAMTAQARQDGQTAIGAQQQAQQARLLAANQQAQSILAQANAYVSPYAAAAAAKTQAAQQVYQQVTTIAAHYQQQLEGARQQAIAKQVDIKVAGAGQAGIPLYAITDIPAASYQAVFDAIVARGYRLVSFSAYVNGADLLYNVIWQAHNTLSWFAWNQLSAAQYQQQFSEMVARGFRLFRIHTYVWAGQTWYAPIFVQEPNPPAWTEFHDLSVPQHQTTYDRYTQQGLRLVNWSITLNTNGNVRIAGLYRQLPGAWSSTGWQYASDYQTTFNQQMNAGLTLEDLAVVNIGGTPTFWANWSSQQYSSWTARHNLDTLGYLAQSTASTKAGQWIRVLTGYMNGNTPNYGGLWGS
jgi:hypothetical protein